MGVDRHYCCPGPFPMTPPPIPTLAVEIYVRKSREKKCLEKKPGNKNFGKKSEFSQVLEKNVTGNKVLCFGFLGLFPETFFSKDVFGGYQLI